MKFTIINIKQGQLLTTTIVVVVALYYLTVAIITIKYMVTISLEKQVLLFWH